MSNTYQYEIDSFKTNFELYKDKKIVLYGIGRYTATLIPYIPEFNVIGLMDRDIENIGKKIYGLPILSKEEARQKADIIIINTSETYWEIIYSRIYDLNIPIYYLNGQKAIKYKQKNTYKGNDYWNQTYNDLVKKVSEYDVISFDIFDTLIMWKVFQPQDIYKLVELKIKNELSIDIDFYRIRLETESNNRTRNITLDEIYQLMNDIWNFPIQLLEKIKKMEIQVTKQNILPRKVMVDFCNGLITSKEIYFISDMYLPLDVLKDILLQCGINKVSNLWISGEMKSDKRSGDLWKKYINQIGSKKKSLHIGDTPISDIKNPQRFGIDTYYIMSSSDMLRNSSLNNIIPKINGLSESVYTGLLCSKLLNNPFAISDQKGIITINDYTELGYCLFGPIICSFLLWIIGQAKEKNLSRFIFFARDGYFLEKDYSYIRQLLNLHETPDFCYLAISRRLALISSYCEESDLDTIINFPYTGTFNEYLLDRFNFVISSDSNHYSEIVNLPSDGEKIKVWISDYKEEIIANIIQERDNYNKYLDSIDIKSTDAVIDLWFYGNNQHYLSKIINKRLIGFYFALNKSKTNQCYHPNMFSCFQQENDFIAEKCNIYKCSLWIESFLTAPYGMIKSIDNNGNYICSPNGLNQLFFKEREYINSGVCHFIKDYLQTSGMIPIQLNRMFIDAFWGEVIPGNIEIKKEIKNIFYYDNSMVKRSEYPIFE